MSVKRRTVLGLMAAMAVVTTLDARAEGSSASPAAESSASSGDFLGSLQKKGIASYLAWLTGPNTQALSGNKDGSGTNLTLTHFATIGYKLTDKMSLTATQAVQQLIDDKPAKEVNPWVFTDPYLTLSHSKLAHAEGLATAFNLSGYLRYYVPVGRGTHDTNNAGRVNDTGYGAMRVFVNPSLSWFDGKLSLSPQTLANFKFASLSREERARRAGGGNGDREDFYVLFDPVLDYQISSKVDVYIEYATGYLRHHSNGKFVTNPRTPGDGQWVSPGLNWSPTKHIALNPYFSWGPEFKGGLKNTDIGLQAQYSFL